VTRRATALFAAALLLVSCGGDSGSAGAGSVTSGSIAGSATTATSLPAAEPAGAPATEPTTAPTSTSITIEVAGIGELAAGLFCRDLDAAGYEYEDAVAYWTREGSPDRMDADRNGIPCESVYPDDDVLAFWGDPLATTTTVPVSDWTPAEVEGAVAADWPDDWNFWAGTEEWACEAETGEPLAAGSVVTCRPAVIPDGEHPVLTILILDADTYTLAVAGLENLLLNASVMRVEVEPGLYCRDLLAGDRPLLTGLRTPGQQYFASVLYWFLEGRPARLDADDNGIPCETLFAPAVVDQLWQGAWYGQPVSAPLPRGPGLRPTIE